MAKTKESSQEKLMGEISNLLSQDLGYIFGEKELGPNGNKKIFLDKSARFLRQLAKDLDFSESKVSKNIAGIACSGEVYMYGMWSEDNGIMFVLEQAFNLNNRLLYRSIYNINDRGSKHGRNQFIDHEVFLNKDYSGLCEKLLNLKAYGDESNVA